MCGEGVMHQGLPFFHIIEIKNMGINLEGVREIHGLEIMLNSPVLAQVMSSNPDIAKQIGKTLKATICHQCSIEQTNITTLAEHISNGENND